MKISKRRVWQSSSAALGLLLLANLQILPSQAATGPRPWTGGYHFDQQDGAALYSAICQGCHMPQGQGAVGAARYPALAANPRLSASYVTYNVLHGLHGMPGFGDDLDDAQVLAVVNYVRSHFGNHYDDPVQADDVKKLR